MKERKRSTATGAALIFLGIGVGIFLARWQVGEGPVIPPTQTQPPAVSAAATVPGAKPLFSPEDAAWIKMQYGSDCPYRPDLEELLCKPIEWTSEAKPPAVLILHTHASECYTPGPGEEFTQSSDYRTLDTAHNLVAVGEEVSRLLRRAGISVVHDQTIHDYPSYSASYTNSRQTIEKHLRQNPSIGLVLDLHRDAMLNSDGSQFAPAVSVPGGGAARMMLVVGTDAGGARHPAWQENLSLGLKLQALLERENPGITRPTMLRAQRFNQDLLPGAVIVEMGAAGNTMSQAMVAAEHLARAVITLMTTADSTS